MIGVHKYNRNRGNGVLLIIVILGVTAIISFFVMNQLQNANVLAEKMSKPISKSQTRLLVSANLNCKYTMIDNNRCDGTKTEFTVSIGFGTKKKTVKKIQTFSPKCLNGKFNLVDGEGSPLFPEGICK